MRKKWKRSKNRILVAMLAFVCTFTQFAPIVNAQKESIWSKHFEDIQYYSNMFYVEGWSSYYGEVQPSDSSLPWGTATIRIPINLYAPNYGDLLSSSDFVYFDLHSMYLYLDNLVETGFVDVQILSCNLVGAGQSFPMNFNTDSWMSCLFDMRSYKESMGEYLLNDVFYMDVNIKYQIYGNYDNGWVAYPSLSFRLDMQSSDLYLMGFNAEVDLGDIKVLLETLHSDNVTANLKLTKIQGDIAQLLLESQYQSTLTSDIKNLLSQLVIENESDKTAMDNFQSNSSSQSSQLNELNQQNKVDKIDIDSASSTVDSNIDLDAVGSSGVVLSALTGQNKILTMLLGVTAISLIAYVFFGKR